MVKNGRRGSLSGRADRQRHSGPHRLPASGEKPGPSSWRRRSPTLADIVWDDGNAHFFPPTTWQISNIHGGTGANNVIPGSVDHRFQLSLRRPPARPQQLQATMCEETLDRHQAWTTTSPGHSAPGPSSPAEGSFDRRGAAAPFAAETGHRQPSCRPRAAHRTVASSRTSVRRSSRLARSTPASTRSTSVWRLEATCRNWPPSIAASSSNSCPHPSDPACLNRPRTELSYAARPAALRRQPLQRGPPVLRARDRQRLGRSRLSAAA
jgi:hypothetical protein